ncbi:MAG TPA: DUF4102 domain-containing protein [candidate division UBP10 bacterium]|nr:DUF4102 domain-containing protein [Candidatus Binatota bacterium]
MNIKLNKKTVEAATAPVTGELILRDSEIRGFWCRVTSSSRTYVLRTRIDGKQRSITLGRHGQIEPAEARRKALQMLGDIARGNDPTAEREASRRSPTFEEFSQRYLSEWAKPRKKPSGLRNDIGQLNNHILPAMGQLKLGQVSKRHVTELHQAMRGTPYEANRVLAQLSKMFNLAEAWDLRPQGSNPCRWVTKYKEEARKRYLGELELRRLGNELERLGKSGEESPYVVAAINLLLMTGARSGEILALRWSYIDFEQGLIHLPDSKTGRKDLEMAAEVREILQSLPRDGGPWVLPGNKEGQHLVNLFKPWSRIRERLNMTDVRINDLRHTFASMSVTVNISLPVIGGLMGHKSTATTQRYAHLMRDTGRQAANQVATDISKALGQK